MADSTPRPNITRDTLLKVMERFVEEKCFTIMRTKGKDYESQGDPFAGLKSNAERSGVRPEIALHVLMNKHLDAIGTFMRRGILHSEPIDERIADAINHLLLLYGYYVAHGVLPMPESMTLANRRTTKGMTEDDLYP